MWGTARWPPLLGKLWILKFDLLTFLCFKNPPSQRSIAQLLTKVETLKGNTYLLQDVNTNRALYMLTSYATYPSPLAFSSPPHPPFSKSQPSWTLKEVIGYVERVEMHFNPFVKHKLPMYLVLDGADWLNEKRTGYYRIESIVGSILTWGFGYAVML